MLSIAPLALPEGQAAAAAMPPVHVDVAGALKSDLEMLVDFALLENIFIPLVDCTRGYR